MSARLWARGGCVVRGGAERVGCGGWGERESESERGRLELQPRRASGEQAGCGRGWSDSRCKGRAAGTRAWSGAPRDRGKAVGRMGLPGCLGKGEEAGRGSWKSFLGRPRIWSWGRTGDGVCLGQVREKRGSCSIERRGRFRPGWEILALGLAASLPPPFVRHPGL